MTNHDWIDYSILVNDVVKEEVKISDKFVNKKNDRLLASPGPKRAVPSFPYICISSFCCLLSLQPGQILSRSRKVCFFVFS